MDWREYVTVNPGVMHGQACIRGTRIPVAVVLANLADGVSAEEILRSYPSLTPPAVQAALKVLVANGEYDKILAKWGLTDGAVKDPVINGALS